MARPRYADLEFLRKSFLKRMSVGDWLFASAFLCIISPQPWNGLQYLAKLFGLLG